MPSRSARRSRRFARTVVARTGSARIEPVEARRLMAAGALDPSWNDQGRLSIAPPTGATAQTTVTAVQIDERVVVAGVSRLNGTSTTSVSRLTPQGKPDTTFNNGNAITVNFTAIGLAVQPNGQILVAGPSIERLNADGSLDTGFGTNGVAANPFTLVGLVVDNQGRIYISGNTTSGGVPQLARYTSAGVLDNTFGTGGIATLAIAGGGSAVYNIGPVTLQTIGGTQQPLVGFAVDGNTALATFGAVRLTTSGGFDPAFGIGGVAEIRGLPRDSVSSTMTVAPDGTIYQAGSYDYGTEAGSGYLMAYSPDGQRAYQSPAPGLNNFAAGLYVGSDNKPVIAGTAIQGSGPGKQTLITIDRFLPVDTSAAVFNFAPDATFGGTGLVTVAYQGASAQDNATTGDIAFSLNGFSNGTIIVGGTSVNPGTSLTSTFNVTKVGGDAAVAQSVGTITGLTYFDQNFDGTRAANDQGLQGYTAFVDTNNDGNLDADEVQAYADATGRITFNGLAPGTYHVVQSVAAGYTHTAPGTTAKVSQTVVLAANQTFTGLNFGITGTDSISGTFFVDVNGNGADDAGEPGINGGIVYLDLNQDGQLTSVDTSVVCDSAGTFTFTHLTPNTFQLRAVLASGHTQTTSPAFPIPVTLVGVQQVTGVLIGQSA